MNKKIIIEKKTIKVKQKIKIIDVKKEILEI